MGIGPGREKPRRSAVRSLPFLGNSALADLEPRVFLVDHVDTTLTAHNAAVLITDFRGFQRIPDFHGLGLSAS